MEQSYFENIQQLERRKTETEFELKSKLEQTTSNMEEIKNNF